MNSGWGDIERDDVTLSDVGTWAAKRRDALSQAFPGERLVIPAGTYKVRSNDTDYVFRPHTDYVWLVGDQTSDAVLVLEPNGTSGHDSVLYFRPRADRSRGRGVLARPDVRRTVGRPPSVADRDGQGVRHRDPARRPAGRRTEE